MYYKLTRDAMREANLPLAAMLIAAYMAVYSERPQNIAELEGEVSAAIGRTPVEQRTVMDNLIKLWIAPPERLLDSAALPQILLGKVGVKAVVAPPLSQVVEFVRFLYYDSRQDLATMISKYTLSEVTPTENTFATLHFEVSIQSIQNDSRSREQLPNKRTELMGDPFKARFAKYWSGNEHSDITNARKNATEHLLGKLQQSYGGKGLHSMMRMVNTEMVLLDRMAVHEKRPRDFGLEECRCYVQQIERAVVTQLFSEKDDESVRQLLREGIVSAS